VAKAEQARKAQKAELDALYSNLSQEEQNKLNEGLKERINSIRTNSLKKRVKRVYI